MQLESQRVGPIRLSERIVFIDVLRGMALFGILAANMRAFFAPLDCYDHIGVLFPSRADVLAQVFIDAFIQGKFISIFSFLFGMGFAIQMSRAEARGVRFMGFYPRRLLALALFGLIHGLLIWAGDILLTYAFSGAILLLFRKRQQKTLLWWAGSLFALPIVASTTFLALYFSRLHRAWMDPKPPDMKKLYAVINIYAHGTVRQILAQNWLEWKQELPYTLFAIYATALFLLGMWVWRAGIVQRLGEYRPVLKRVCAWCIPVGLVINIYVTTVRAVLPPYHRFAVGVFCWNTLAAWSPYPERRLCFWPGPYLHARGLAALSAALCRGGADGIDGLLDAIRVVHPVLLSLHNRSLWAHRTSDRVGAHGHPLWGTGRVQQLVVEAISLWPHGVAVARHDLRQVPVDAQRGTYADDRSARALVLAHHALGD